MEFIDLSVACEKHYNQCTAISIGRLAGYSKNPTEKLYKFQIMSSCFFILNLCYSLKQCEY